MTVFPLRTTLYRRDEALPDGEEATSIVPAWLLAVALTTFFGLVTLSQIEPFHYEGVGRHLTVTALFALYILGWKEVFRRYVED